MPNERSIVAPAGNPKRAVFLVFAVLFPVIISPGARVWSARAIEEEGHHPANRGVLAAWRLMEEECRNSARSEWRRSAWWILGLLPFLAILSALVAVEMVDIRAVAIMLAACMLLAIVMLAVEMPPLRTRERTREVRVATAHTLSVCLLLR